jgi:hypothetical protein
VRLRPGGGRALRRKGNEGRPKGSPGKENNRMEQYNKMA